MENMMQFMKFVDQEYSKWKDYKSRSRSKSPINRKRRFSPTTNKSKHSIGVGSDEDDEKDIDSLD
jgi:hypothetical protein